MRWLLLENIHSIRKGSRATAFSSVPKSPYSAEVLFIEMMAQTGGLLVGAESDYRKDLIFAKIEKATIVTVPESGTPLRIEAWSECLGAEGGWLEATITCDAGPVASARLLLMAVDGLSPQQTQSTTFHDAFMTHFNVREKVLPGEMPSGTRPTSETH